MAAKVGIFVAILLVCAILIPSLASAFLENDSRKTDVSINGENDHGTVVQGDDNDLVLHASDDETRKERSLTGWKKLFMNHHKTGKKFHARGSMAFDFHHLIKGSQKVVGAFARGVTGNNVPQTAEQQQHQNIEQQQPHTKEENVPQNAEQHVPQTAEQQQPQANEQHVPQDVGQQVPQTAEEHVEPEVLGGLREGFYQKTCPQAEEIIRNGLVRVMQNNSKIVAAIPRLFFHDCFVNGCDGSILLDTTPSGAEIEKSAGQNGITVKGYELIDEIKLELEKNCPGIVSCSDILAYLSRDAFVASGLPHYEVSGGRRDGMESLEENVADNIPVPDDSVDLMIELFNRKGLNAEDLVVLIGAHSIGVAHCFNFLYRMDDPEKAKMVEPRLGNVMRFTCTNQLSTLAFDAATQYKMDSVYYKQLLMNRGLLESDQILAQDIRTRGLVQQFNNDEIGWFDKFGKAMNKLGAVEVLTGNQGQIRKQCRAVNA
ncbi:hypothetical protein CQW23_02737 [Capsicum baccatum]|uniref:peroxidase n=1 Tax=Capsicum baccatum TaxID=33114 RepID=A0A2G2XSA1_CAPBA|nr:hypothetical protein CQW23_02737 [Capsicum baccatum]